MLKSRHARGLSTLARVVVLAALTPGVALGATAHSGTASKSQAVASRSGLIPVWAYLSGSDPVAGGRVSIIADGKPVPQLGARADQYTNANGVALVEVRRVPGRFTVVVRGGRAAGEHLDGALRSIAAPDPDAGVVEVNPLTALVTQLRAERPRLGLRRASRAVKRYFGVPLWTDLGQDLRDGPQWFSVRTYARDARRYGSIERLNRIVARQLLRSGSGGRERLQRTGASLAPDLARGGPGAGTVQRAGLSDVTAGQLVVTVFKHLGGTALGIGSHTLVGGALGGLLQLARLVGIPLPKTELEQAKDQLTAIGTQLTDLQEQVNLVSKSIANSDASRLLHQSDHLTASIDHATNELALLAKVDPNETARRKALADTITGYIGSHLLDAPAHFNTQLNPAFAIADNPIKATSRAVATSSRFFDSRQSDEVQAVYDYYAMYEAELAVLLTNYWNTDPVTYPLKDREERVEKIRTSVTKTQRESLKPTVPAGTFIDTQTPLFMWGTSDATENALELLTTDKQTRFNISLGPFHNYQLPSARNLENLLRGWTGNPRTWLQAQIQVRLSHQLVWTSNTFQGSCQYTITIFDLNTAKLEQYLYGGQGATFGGCDVNKHYMVTREKEFLRRKTGGLLMLRYLAPGESYWWTGG